MVEILHAKKICPSTAVQHSTVLGIFCLKEVEIVKSLSLFSTLDRTCKIMVITVVEAATTVIVRFNSNSSGISYAYLHGSKLVC